jgi:hypothetical protein
MPERPHRRRDTRARRLRAGALALVSLLATVWGIGGLTSCVTPTDPLTTGALCAPSSQGCPSQVTLFRDRLGRNLLDYTITGRGPATTARLVARLPSDAIGDAGTTSLDDASSDASSRDAGAASEIDEAVLAVRTFDNLSEGDSVSGRLLPEDLGRPEEVVVTLSCSAPSCSVRAEYAWLTQPLECRDDGDCRGSWRCDDETGRCAECLEDGDCLEEQRCDRQAGRCLPVREQGCATTGPGAPHGGGALPLYMLALLGLCALVARRRGRRRAVAVVASGTVLVASMAPAGLEARPPGAGFGLSAGPRFFTGPIAEVTSYGLGLSIEQELRTDWIGGKLRLDVGYFLTRQQGPPFTREMQTWGVVLGPMFYYRLGPVEVVGGPEYQRFGLLSNGLVAYTDGRLAFHGLGGTVGGRWRWSSLEVRAEFGAQKILGLPTALLTVNLGVAIVTAP